MGWFTKTQGYRDSAQSADISAARGEISRRGRRHLSSEQQAEGKEKLKNLRRGMSSYDARCAAAETVKQRDERGACVYGKANCGRCSNCYR